MIFMNKKPFKNTKKKNSQHKTQEYDENYEFHRTRFPKGNEVLGIVLQRLGASRLRVRCFDGHERVCRIPGSKKRYLWIRENDIVLVQPWETQSDQKGDVIYKYKKNQENFLRRKGYLDKLNEFTDDL